MLEQKTLSLTVMGVKTTLPGRSQLKYHDYVCLPSMSLQNAVPAPWNSK